MPAETTQEIRLLGQPTLQDHLSFVRDRVVGGDQAKRIEIVDDWRRANDYYGELEESEAGLADEIDIINLDPSMQPLVDRAMQDPRYVYTFDKFPTSFAMVELDKLVVYQSHINPEFSAVLQQRLEACSKPEDLFHFCMPPEAPEDTVQVRKVGSRRFQFSSTSTDFRSHSPALLTPDQISDFDTFGPLSAMVGLGIGFGSNFLTGIRVDDRLMLHNGYHRAHAMRARGITHAPCIIQTVTRRDELEIAAKRSVSEDSNFYFGADRPPLLKDFFDPLIRHEYTVYKCVKMIEINFEITDYQVRL